MKRFYSFYEVTILLLVHIFSFYTLCQGFYVGIPPIFFGRDGRNAQSANNTEMPPQPDPNTPMRIKVKVFIDHISSVRALEMDFRMDFFLQNSWEVNQNFCSVYKTNLEEKSIQLKKEFGEILLSPNSFNLFWMPDTYTQNAKDILTHMREGSSEVLKISTDGNEDGNCSLAYTRKISAIISCNMKFEKYPVDVQHCPVYFRSYAYHERLVQYYWDDVSSAVPHSEDLKLLQHDYRLFKGETIMETLNVSYSVVHLNLVFQRLLPHYIIQVFAPSSLIVTMSWFSFWMGLDAIPGRITLCVTSLLTLFTQFSTIRHDVPPVTYVTGLDIWMFICMMFVFATLLEFTVVKYLDTQVKLRKNRKKDQVVVLKQQHSVLSVIKEIPEPGEKSSELIGQSSLPQAAWKKTTRNSAVITPLVTDVQNKQPESDIEWVSHIDFVSRSLFPFLFVTFNAIYWPFLLQNW